MRLLKDGIFRNDGSGNFDFVKILPHSSMSSYCLSSHDWDRDGDQDLFVAGRNSPGQYPVAPPYYFLRNEGEAFEDVTGEIAARAGTLGMVTDAEWIDWNGDGIKDLVVVGEWTTPVVLIATSTGFIRHEPLADAKGWWQSIHKSDLDGDGDEDLILGNLGLNNKFHPSEEKPLHIYSNDFDEDGRLDIVLGKETEEDLIYPVRGRECSSDQMPMISQRFTTYEAFAIADLKKILGKEQISRSLHLQAQTFESIILENLGAGEFKQRELPLLAQAFPVKSMIELDVNKDGIPDFFVTGNLIHTEVETTPYDAGKGLLLIGKGDCTFEAKHLLDDTHLLVPGQVSNMVPIKLEPGKEDGFLIGRNNGLLQLILINK